ncbi:DUF4298 domain-containing protein [Candidatus Gracilibacteria bacterium]|nr:DUF4298 domain-containing protein [Candidatus Gracilibacteria bacterium]
MNQETMNRVASMEKILNDTQKILENLQDAQQKWLENFENFQKLSEYYSSDKWFEDVQMEFPQDFPHGVLSEDGAYNLFVDQGETARKSIEIALKYL